MKLQTLTPKEVGQALRTQGSLSLRIFKGFSIIRNSNNSEKDSIPASFLAHLFETKTSNLQCFSHKKTVVIWETLRKDKKQND